MQYRTVLQIAVVSWCACATTLPGQAAAPESWCWVCWVPLPSELTVSGGLLGRDYPINTHGAALGALTELGLGYPIGGRVSLDGWWLGAALPQRFENVIITNQPHVLSAYVARPPLPSWIFSWAVASELRLFPTGGNQGPFVGAGADFMRLAWRNGYYANNYPIFADSAKASRVALGSIGYARRAGDTRNLFVEAQFHRIAPLDGSARHWMIPVLAGATVRF